jgi:hypothetical protein
MGRSSWRWAWPSRFRTAPQHTACNCPLQLDYSYPGDNPGRDSRIGTPRRKRTRQRKCLVGGGGWGGGGATEGGHRIQPARFATNQAPGSDHASPHLPSACKPPRQLWRAFALTGAAGGVKGVWLPGPQARWTQRAGGRGQAVLAAGARGPWLGSHRNQKRYTQHSLNIH